MEEESEIFVPNPTQSQAQRSKSQNQRKSSKKSTKILNNPHEQQHFRKPHQQKHRLNLIRRGQQHGNLGSKAPDLSELMARTLQSENRFLQQRLRKLKTAFSCRSIGRFLLIMSVVLVPLGTILLFVSLQAKEFRFPYGEECKNSRNYLRMLKRSCIFCAGGSNPSCYKEIYVPISMRTPVFLYYEIDSFHQNHRHLVKSLDEAQLRGKIFHPPLPKVKENSAVVPSHSCSPYKLDGEGKFYFPCGAMANTMFSDEFIIQTSKGHVVPLRITQITQPMVKKHKFKNPIHPVDVNQKNYYYKKDFANNFVKPREWTDEVWDSWWKYGGNENERFMNWMIPNHSPKVRKLYAVIDSVPHCAKGVFCKGNYTVYIEYRFDVDSIKGTKSIILSVPTFLGTRNLFLPLFVIIAGLVKAYVGFELLKFGELCDKNHSEMWPNIRSSNRLQTTENSENQNQSFSVTDQVAAAQLQGITEKLAQNPEEVNTIYVGPRKNKKRKAKKVAIEDTVPPKPETASKTVTDLTPESEEPTAEQTSTSGDGTYVEVPLPVEFTSESDGSTIEQPSMSGVEASAQRPISRPSMKSNATESERNKAQLYKKHKLETTAPSKSQGPTTKEPSMSGVGAKVKSRQPASPRSKRSIATESKGNNVQVSKKHKPEKALQSASHLPSEAEGSLNQEPSTSEATTGSPVSCHNKKSNPTEYRGNDAQDSKKHKREKTEPSKPDLAVKFATHPVTFDSERSINQEPSMSNEKARRPISAHSKKSKPSESKENDAQGGKKHKREKSVPSKSATHLTSKSEGATIEEAPKSQTATSVGASNPTSRHSKINEVSSNKNFKRERHGPSRSQTAVVTSRSEGATNEEPPTSPHRHRTKPPESQGDDTQGHKKSKRERHGPSKSQIAVVSSGSEEAMNEEPPKSETATNSGARNPTSHHSKKIVATESKINEASSNKKSKLERHGPSKSKTAIVTSISQGSTNEEPPTSPHRHRAKPPESQGNDTQGHKKSKRKNPSRTNLPPTN